jgi:hypothetical protein
MGRGTAEDGEGGQVPFLLSLSVSMRVRFLWPSVVFLLTATVAKPTTVNGDGLSFDGLFLGCFDAS